MQAKMRCQPVTSRPEGMIMPTEEPETRLP